MISLKDAIDIHVHTAPDIFARIGDAVDIAERAHSYSMGGIVFKAHHEATVTHAHFVRRFVNGFQAWGGITLNRFVGGINPVAVRMALALGAKMVWMPTIHSSNHLERLSTDAMATHSIAGVPVGIRILDQNGSLTTEVKQVVDLVRKYGGVLSTGHLGEIEIRELVSYCATNKVKCVVTHGFFLGQSLDFLIEMAGAGAVIELSAAVALPMAHYRGGGMTLVQARDLIRSVGAERVVLSTDAGQIHNPWPADTLLAFLNSLHAVGVSEEDLRSMIVDRPRQLLGINGVDRSG